VRRRRENNSTTEATCARVSCGSWSLKREDIESEVKKVLEKSDFKDISVEVKNGVVRLKGTVLTGSRRLDAAVLARSVKGVRAVRTICTLRQPRANRACSLRPHDAPGNAGGLHRTPTVDRRKP
jgi:BON domain